MSGGTGIIRLGQTTKTDYLRLRTMAHLRLDSMRHLRLDSMVPLCLDSMAYLRLDSTTSRSTADKDMANQTMLNRDMGRRLDAVRQAANERIGRNKRRGTARGIRITARTKRSGGIRTWTAN